MDVLDFVRNELLHTDLAGTHILCRCLQTVIVARFVIITSGICLKAVRTRDVSWAKAPSQTKPALKYFNRRYEIKFRLMGTNTAHCYYDRS